MEIWLILKRIKGFFRQEIAIEAQKLWKGEMKRRKDWR